MLVFSLLSPVQEDSITCLSLDDASIVYTAVGPTVRMFRRGRQTREWAGHGGCVHTMLLLGPQTRLPLTTLTVDESVGHGLQFLIVLRRKRVAMLVRHEVATNKSVCPSRSVPAGL